MKYTYKFETQGNSQSHYLMIGIDRPITDQYMSMSSMKYEDANPQQLHAKDLIDALNTVQGVIPCSKTFSTGGGLITLSGNAITIQICELDPKKLVPLVQRVIKKVQRRYAPNEGRNRIRQEELAAAFAGLNK